MRTRLILRLLAADATLLAWTEVWAEARGDRCLRSVDPCVVIVPDVSGRCAEFVVHWPDVHIQVRSVFVVDIVAGTPLTLDLREPLIRLPSHEGPLPAVTVKRSVTLTIPTGALAAAG